MKNKVLTVTVVVGLIYLIYYLISFLSGPPNNPFIFRQKYLYYGAQWFNDKGVTKIVSTEQIGKHKNIFEDFEIDVAGEEYVESTESETFGERTIDDKPPVDSNFIDINHFIKLADRTNAKGLYIQGHFAANKKNMELFQDFIDNKGFIYFNSPADFFKLTESFIKFLEKHVSSGSISVLDFTKMVHTSGSSVLDNLDYLIQYNDSNPEILIKKLQKQLENQKNYIKEEIEFQE